MLVDGLIVVLENDVLWECYVVVGNVVVCWYDWLVVVS